MKICAIRDEEMHIRTDLAYLFYFPGTRAFHIEIPASVNIRELPILFFEFAKRGKYTLNSYWSYKWVAARIVPVDRQNLGDILKAHGMTCYDEWQMLRTWHGRCEQDACYLKEITAEKLPGEILERRKYFVRDLVSYGDDYLFFFEDSTEGNDLRARRCHVQDLIPEEDKRFLRLITDRKLSVAPDGYGISLGGQYLVDGKELYENSVATEIPLAEVYNDVSKALLGTAEAVQRIGCSRQYLNRLVQDGRLHPVLQSGRNMAFLKGDVDAYIRSQ